jgi:hypothetical protein
MSIATQLRSYTYDSTQLLKDAGLVATSAAAQVGGSAKRLEVGQGFFKGVLVIDVTAIETDSSNELYRITVQGSDSPTFASGIENLASIDLGHTSARSGSAGTSTVGRYELPFTNEQNGQSYAYVRVFTAVAGTIATGINYTALVGLDRLPA